jgi:hypothetical protein
MSVIMSIAGDGTGPSLYASVKGALFLIGREQSRRLFFYYFPVFLFKLRYALAYEIKYLAVGRAPFVIGYIMELGQQIGIYP